METSILMSTQMGDVSNDLHKTMGGKLAGICYMEGKFSDPKVSSDEAGNKRALECMASGHHSTHQHTSKTMELDGLPKLGAMMLNSLGVYTTSEKSARYTKMQPETEKELELYEWWTDWVSNEYKKMYTQAKETDARKRGMEVARYMISVFTPTYMAYTTNTAQWNYIYDWMERLIDSLKFQPKTNSNGIESFESRVIKIAEDIMKAIKKHCYIEELRDIKGRKLEFLSFQVNSSLQGITKEYYGDTYTAIYEASMSQLAQQHRHRTLKYVMIFSGLANKFVMPRIVSERNMEEKWLTDISSVSEYFPQGTLVKVIERGCTEDFLLKCSERMCKNAQLETADQAKATLEKILASYNVSSGIKEEAEKYFNSQTNMFRARCEAIGFKCNRPCGEIPEDRVYRLF